MVFVPQARAADTVRVERLRHDINFSSNGRTAETTAIFDDAGFTGAAFRDGVFDGPDHVDLGGWARIALVNGNGPFGSAGSPNFAGVELIRQLPVSGQWEYRLQTTEIIYPQVSTVPLPAPSR